jgi:hypothetical protein
MNIDPTYEPRTLIEPFLEGPVVQSFLRDTFFTGREYPPTAMIEFDFRRGRRKMAPFVAPLVGGKVMERQGYETRFFRAPRIAPARALRTPDLEARLPGENIYSGRTQADRAADLLAEDSVFLDESITRREEWMCRQVLVNGGITVTAENGYQMVIDYTQSAANPAGLQTVNHDIPAVKWDVASGSDPLADLEASRLNTIKASGVAPNVVLMGANAAKVFIRNPQVAALLDKMRYNIALVEPIIQNDAVIRIGRVPGMEIYEYVEYFEDDAGNLFPMIPDNFVMLLNVNVPNKIVYGAFTQLENAKTKTFVTYQTARIPLVYGDEEDGQLWYRLTACPLPMPYDIMGFRIIEALALTYPAMGPGGGGKEGEEVQPYFEADQGAPGKGPKGDNPDGYDELTVAELKGEAESRNIEVPHGAKKQDIIDLLRAADQSGGNGK